MSRKCYRERLAPQPYRREAFQAVLGSDPEARFNRKFVRLDPTSLEIVANEILDRELAIRCLECLVVLNAVRGNYQQVEEALRVMGACFDGA